MLYVINCFTFSLFAFALLSTPLFSPIPIKLPRGFTPNICECVLSLGRGFPSQPLAEEENPPAFLQSY